MVAPIHVLLHPPLTRGKVMYLVTWEDEDGTWLDDPEGFDTEKEARNCATKYPARHGGMVAIYDCRLIDAIDSPAPSPADSGAARE